jgi:glycosyltransferase involved in cell wall biosynthesis
VPTADPPTVDVILPCLNEEAALPWVLSRMPAGMRAIVVDNGSTDSSVEIALHYGATVATAEPRGYGAACHAGLLAAEATLVAVMDADGSLDPQQLIRVIDPVATGTVDLMLGHRQPIGFGAQPWPLKWANRELARRLRRRTGQPLSDLGPMRAARRVGLLDLDLRDRRSGYPAETVVRAADAGWRIGETPVDYRPRVGRSKVTGTPLGAWRAVRDLSAALGR